MIGFPLGVLYANLLEAANHRFVLHGLGKKKTSFWGFHWHEHHRNVRKHGHYDPDYHRSRIGFQAQGKETLGMVAACVAHLPLLPIAPFFTAGAITYAVGSWWAHKRAHLDPGFAKRWVPWHYDHHMGPDQHANWGTLLPFADMLMGTRIKYLGTEKQRLDDERRAKRAEAQPQPAHLR